MLAIFMLIIFLSIFIISNWLIFAYDKKDLSYGKHLGKVISKEKYMTYLGEAIRLGVKFKSKIINFENAKQILDNFNIGDNVEWTKVLWMKDPRGTDNLK